LVGVTLLFVVLLTVIATQAQVPGKFDRIRRLGPDEFLTRRDGAAQQKQASAPYTPLTPPQAQYMVIELGGRRANDISESGQIVGNKVFEAGIRHAAFWPSSQSAPIDLGTLPGLGSVVEGINLRREMVGYAFNDDGSTELPLFWASTNSAPV